MQRSSTQDEILVRARGPRNSISNLKGTVMDNPFCHVELASTDVSKAKNFYSTPFKPEGGPGGGMMQHPVPGAPSAWLAYVLVDDVAAATKKAASLGAQVMRDVTEVMGMGSLSIIIDPTGAALGLWQPKMK